MSQIAWKQVYRDKLTELADMSAAIGARTDYVQGGGGNTSVKLDSACMAIKASGYRLSQVTQDAAFAVLDHQRLRAFFRQAEIGVADHDIETVGRVAVENARLQLAGIPVLRPSVEAGFHAILGACVLHTHAVYVNCIGCAEQSVVKAAEAMKPLGLAWSIVPYIDPGTRLTFALGKEIVRLRKENGAGPLVLLMQNHGVVVSADDAAMCLAIHDRVNRRMMEILHLNCADWPQPAIVARQAGTGFQSQTLWLQQRLRTIQNPVDFFTKQPLYPDQMVYLTGKIAQVGDENEKAVCQIDSRTGDVSYLCGAVEAAAIEETMCAVLFIHETQKANGFATRPMSAAARAFIADWESEAYRRQVAAGGSLGMSS